MLLQRLFLAHILYAVHIRLGTQLLLQLLRLPGGDIFLQHDRHHQVLPDRVAYHVGSQHQQDYHAQQNQHHCSTDSIGECLHSPG